jgi:RNA polymerase-binding transcription factor DksA
MASKTPNKPPAKPAKSAKLPQAAPAKAAVKAAVKAAKPDKPASKVTAKPATGAIARATRHERPARHEKPGTGRVNRGASAERMSAAAGEAPERHSAPAAAGSGNLSSPFGKQELAEWRLVLLEHRSEISQDINHLEQGAMEAEDGHTTPNHIAERGSDAEMQDMSLGLAGEEQIVLWQIDRALRKIDSGSPAPFGLCEHTKQPIPKMRLQLIPWTPVTIEGMNYVEENGLSLEDVLVDG